MKSSPPSERVEWARCIAPAIRGCTAITADGQRFVGRIMAGSAGSTDAGAPMNAELQVVLNWFEELKARVPTKP
jgi:hypothetical protein